MIYLLTAIVTLLLVLAVIYYKRTQDYRDTYTFGEICLNIALYSLIVLGIYHLLSWCF